MMGLILTGVLGFASTACGSDDYYCDETGCFVCDGIGCRQIDPPDRNACLGDYQCPASQVCSSTGCVDRCAEPDACPRGTVCRGNICLGPTEPTPTLLPSECREKVDCTGDQICVEGTCQDPGNFQLCTDDIDCADVCVDGVCRTRCDDTQSEQASTLECRRIDSQFLACRNGFCRTQREL